MEPLDTSKPFLTKEAVSCGVSERSLAGPSYQRIFRGCHIGSEVPLDPSVLHAAALLVVPEAYALSHQSAAQAMHLEVPRSPYVHLATPKDQRCRLQGIQLHRLPEKPTVYRFSGVPTTTPAQTLIDLASTLSLVDLTVVADAMLHRRLVPRDRLESHATGHAASAKRARAALRLANAGAESPMETRVRLLLKLAGLPDPVANLSIEVAESRTRRVDLGYPDVLVAIEYDGRHHIDRRGQWEGDIRRREELESLGWRVIVLTASDVFSCPSATLERVRDALKSRDVLVGAFDQGWRMHFSDRGDYLAS